MLKRIIPFFLLFFIVLIYTRPYFREGFFSTHDGEWAIVRMSEMQRELKDRQIPPRWADYLNHGYGYPLFSYTYPFPFYLATILRSFHFGYTDSIKIIFVGSVFLSALFMFLLGREISGDLGGFLASTFYIVAPFRLVDLYVRGSIGESLSLAIFPMLCFFSLRYILKPDVWKLIITAIILGILILSHNIMALIFFPLWVIFLYTAVISYYEDVKVYSWKYFLPVILLGLGLSAYFFIPALLEKNFVELSRIKLADLSKNFINLRDYLLSPWSYDKPSSQLGWAHILGAILGFIGVILSPEIIRRKYLPMTIYIFSGILIIVFFAHPFSSDFWNVPPLAWLDFPWRLLTPLAFFLALAACLLSIHKVTKVIGVVLVLFTVLLSIGFAKPAKIINHPDIYYVTNDATTTSMDELMPLWVSNSKKPKDRYKEKVEVEKGKGTISNLDFNSKIIRFQLVSQTPVTVKVNTIYFPGWVFQVDENNVELNFGGLDGLMRFDLGPGKYQIIGRFTETNIRLFSDIISLISIAVIICLLFYSILTAFRKKPV